MRKRTRRRRYSGLNINGLAFICFVISVSTVLGLYFANSNKFAKGVVTNQNETLETQTVKVNTEDKVNSYSVSNIFLSALNDITTAEKKASELTEISNDGKIYTEDYLSKNATASVGNVYIRNTTKSHNINIEDYLKKSIVASVKDKNEPAVLVYHTHSSESYQIIENEFYSKSLVADFENLGVLRVGDALCNAIEKSGYKVIHDRTVYDTTYSGAFEASRANVIKILKENPSIQIVIDLHRDSISRKDGTKIKTVTEINGKKTAQIEIVAGCEDGLVTGFPNWEKNLTFAVHLQKAIADDYPNAVRPLLFTSRKYNMDLISCAVNINIGTEANTVREAVYSAEILGNGVVKILKECEK